MDSLTMPQAKALVRMGEFLDDASREWDDNFDVKLTVYVNGSPCIGWHQEDGETMWLAVEEDS